MDHPLDPFVLSLAEGQQVNLIRLFSMICMVIGAVGFIYFWFVAVRIWVLNAHDALKNKRGFRWMNDLRNPFVQRFMKTVLKAFLVWLIAGWPLVFVLTGLVSTEAMNELLGYGAIAEPD